MIILKRLLAYFDVDIYTERCGGNLFYMVRVWDEGEPIIECRDTSLASAIIAADRNAAVVANYS